jgi:hypothetical protein
MPAERASDLEGLIRLVREDRASWEGGKPEGAASPVGVRGKAVSEIIIEERR